jgi:hypothetical protein
MRVLLALALVPLLLSATLGGPEAHAPHGPLAQPDPAKEVDNRLQLINNTFHQRLESTYKYQQAIMPTGYTSVERYLQLGNKKYLLEYALDDQKAGRQMREDYSLRFLNHDTVRVGKAHYVAGTKRTTESVQGYLAFSSEYLNDSYFEVTNLLITQTFDPLAVLALRPDAAQTGQWLYARSTQAAEQGDTVASYHLFRSRTGDTCRVQLRERSAEQQLQRYAQRESWRSAQRRVCSWQVELTRRRLTAEQVLPGEEGGIIRWVRIYRTATDFTETLTGQYRIGYGGPPHTVAYVWYSRDFTQINPSRSVDTFTVFDMPTNFNEPSDFNWPSVTKAAFTFSVLSTYR